MNSEEKFNFKFKYEKGKNHQAADALSRINRNLEMHTLERSFLDEYLDDIDEVIITLPHSPEQEISEILGEPQNAPMMNISSDIQLDPN